VQFFDSVDCKMLLSCAKVPAIFQKTICKGGGFRWCTY